MVHEAAAMIRVMTHSEAGGHAHNEDAFAIGPHPDDPHSLLCALGDGQGGQPGGGPAARLACETFLDRASCVPLARLMLLHGWNDVLTQVDRDVAEDPGAGFTTLAAFAVARGRLAGAACGDSALVVAGPEQAPLALTARQRKSPAVGSGGAVFIPFSAALSPPWVVLAMTDGVWKYAGWDAVHQAAAGAADDLIRPLRQRAGLPGSGALQDDFTLVVLRGAQG
jgi:PPM family protein phosphatase